MFWEEDVDIDMFVNSCDVFFWLFLNKLLVCIMFEMIKLIVIIVILIVIYIWGFLFEFLIELFVVLGEIGDLGVVVLLFVEVEYFRILYFFCNFLCNL